MPIEPIISNELQLGQQLNHSVVGERAKFALLLALMSPNVEEQAQFHLASNGQEGSSEDNHEKSIDLNQQFNISRAQTLLSDDAGELQSLQIGKIISEQQLIDARLLHCLNPEPLSFELGKIQGIERDVYDNLDPIAARKLQGNYQIEPIEKIIVNDLIERQQNYSARLN